ncbi:MAG: DUF819 family protein [Pseudomonadota bacterium]
MAYVFSFNDVFVTLAIILLVCAFAAWSERTHVGKHVSGAMVVIILTIILASFGVLPRTSALYDVIWAYLVPMAIGLFLLKSDLQSVAREGGRVLVAFAIGAAGVIVGGFVAAQVLGLTGEEERYVAIIIASLTGGSLNFAVVAKALGYADMSALAALVTIDSVLGLVFFVSLGLLAKTNWLQSHFAWRVEHLAGDAGHSPSAGQHSVTLMDLLVALACVSVIVVASQTISRALGVPDYDVLLITSITVGLATIGRRYLSVIRGEDTIAMLFMYLFFAMMGAGADIASMFSAAPSIFFLVLIIMVVHLAFMYVGGRLLRMNYAELVIGSFACIGGPPIAAAFAALFGWRRLMAPGILVGVFGYVIGSFLGIGFYQAITL